MQKVIFLLLFLFVMFLTSCSHVEDMNGPDDYSVVTFSDEDILNGLNYGRTTYVSRINSYLNNKLYGEYKVRKMSGLDKIFEYRTDEKYICFELNFVCESGNAMLVLLYEGKIIKKVEANQTLNFEILNQGDEYRMLLVGESAKVSIAYVVYGTDASTIKEQNFYSVRFEDGFGNEVETVSVQSGKLINEPSTPVKNGYRFLGWYFEGKKWDFSDSIVIDNMVLVAKWETEITQFTFETFGGRGVSSVSGVAGNLITQETFRPGTEFIGWCIDKECTQLIDSFPAESCTLYAKYEVDHTVSQGLEYHYDGNNVILIGKGTCTDSNVVIPEGVTRIGNRAFSNCDNLISVQIPDCVISINGYAFYNCINLTSVNIPENITIINDHVFYNCSSLMDINDMLKNITSIDDYAFYGCSSLTSVEIPETVTSIGSYVFGMCVNLVNINFPKNITSLSEYIFKGCSSLTNVDHLLENITIIGNGSFSGCRSLTSVEIPETVTSIEQNAFSNCINLTNINLPSNITKINNNTFMNCSSLTTINLPEKITSIGEFVFSGCSSLISIDIPNSVTSIGMYAFSGCVNLTTINLPENITTLSDSIFKDCISLKFIEIPSNITYIGYSAFEGCVNLIDIVIPKNITRICNNAFKGCSNLTTINLPENITTLSDSVFEDCISLKFIEIPSNITYIDYSAFKGCANLTDIVIPKNITRICSNVFKGCDNLENIYFYGTREEFNKIIFDDYMPFNYTTIKFFYSESEPTSDGNYWHYDDSGKIVKW